MTSSEPVEQVVSVLPASTGKTYAETFIGTENGPIRVLPAYDSLWNGFHPKWGNYRVWIDATGVMRLKNGAPTSDTDGTAIGVSGTQVFVVAPGEDPPPGTPVGSIVFEA